MNSENNKINMKNVNAQSNTSSDGLYFLAILLKYKKFIISTTVVATIASVIVAFCLPLWFASTVSFVPPQSSNDNASFSGLSSVMKDFGLAKIGNSGASQEYSMLVFLESRSVIDSIIKKYDLATRYEMQELPFSKVREAFISNMKISFLDNGNFELTIWDKNKQVACDIANDYVNITNHFAEKTYKEETNINIEYLTARIHSVDSTIVSISAELSKLVNVKNMFSPEEQFKAAGTAIADMKSTMLQFEMTYDFYKKNYGENDPMTINAKEMMQTAKEQSDKLYSQPGFIGNFALRDATPIAVEYLNKYADIEALTKTKAMLTTSLEKTILDSKKNVKNFFVIDKAIPADVKDKPKRSFIVAGGAVGGLILSIFIVLIINSFKISFKQIQQLKDDKITN